jgi:hypothetical protein
LAERSPEAPYEPRAQFSADFRLFRRANCHRPRPWPPGSSPPPEVKITEHSTVMSDFVMVTSPPLGGIQDFGLRAQCS